MSIHTFALRHRLYAYTVNAAGIRGGSNAPLGELDAAGKVPANIIETIDALLASIAPEGSSAAYAVQRFDAPGETNSFLCLVASHPTVDVDQRPASLNHGRILCIDSADAWLDIQALIGLAETFQIGSLLNRSPGEIRDHLLDTESSVTAGDWNDTPLRNVDAPLAQSVIEACLSSVNRRETQVVPLPRQETSLGALRDVLQKVHTARHHVDLFRDKLVPQARQAFEANQFAYETGKATFLEWITAQRNLRDLEAMGQQHVADYYAALAELEAVVGADLNLFPSTKTKETK